ncbi:ubiquinol-cytochrome c reductase cytochrome b subunit [Nonomuraea pusilla]|uniref:cytochrome bc1 complex cytochrome b subunit n=1 Tax=Nonomuraea pusilla TaxID=46177 RepID=UPI0033249E2E
MIIRWLGRGAARWFDGRLRLASTVRTAVAKVFPDHWSFMLGEIALYSFVTLVLTGTFLTLFFVPATGDVAYHGSYAPLRGSTMSAAYASTVELSFDVRGGLLFRQVHHWSALVFLAAIVVHLSRVFFTGAFRKPREINWLVGVTLFATSIANGFAGYSLPDDLLSATGLRIAYSTLLSLPLVGPWAAFLLFGGEFPGESIVPRLYVAHVLLLPGLIAALVGVHMAVLVRQKHTHFPGPGRTDRTVVGSKLWPAYAFRSLALLCAVLAVAFGLGALVQINPIWSYGPFQPAAATSPAQPDWFLGWVEGALRLFPPVEFRVFGHLVPAPFLPGVVMPGLTFLVLYAWPWIDRAVTGDRGRHQVLDRPRHRPARVAVGVWALSFYGLLLLSAADDLVAKWLRVPVLDLVRIMRVVVIVVPLLLAAVGFAVARALRGRPADTVGTLRWADLTSPGEARDDRR